jgi:hypothetical protein
MYQEPTTLPCHMYRVQGNSSFTARTKNSIKKICQNFETLELHSHDIRLKCVQSIFPYRFIQSHKILKKFVHTHDSQLIQRTHL